MISKKKAGLLTAAVVVSLTMLSNVAQAENKVTIGDFTVQGGKIYHGGQERSALFNNYLSSNEYIKFDENIHWKLTAGGETVQYQEWIPEQEIYNNQGELIDTIPAHWSDWKDSVYSGAFKDREGNTIAQTQNGGYEIFDKSINPDSSGTWAGHTGYAREAIGKFNSSETDIYNFAVESPTFKPTITGESLNTNHNTQSYIGLTVSTKAPKNHNADGTFNGAAGPFTMKVSNGDLSGNTITGPGGILLEIDQNYYYWDEQGQYKQLATTLEVENTNIKNNRIYLTDDNTFGAVGGSLFWTDGRNANGITDKLKLDNVHVDNNRYYASAGNTSTGMGAVTQLNGYTEITGNSTFDQNYFQSNNRHKGNLAVRGVGLAAADYLSMTGGSINQNHVDIVGDDNDHQSVSIYGVGLHKSGKTDLKTLEVNENALSLSKAEGTVSGVGIYNDGGYLALNNVRVLNNSAALTKGHYFVNGIGVMDGSGLFSAAYSQISNNSLSMGGDSNDIDWFDVRGIGLYTTGGNIFDTHVQYNKFIYNDPEYFTTNKEPLSVSAYGGGIHYDGNYGLNPGFSIDSETGTVKISGNELQVSEETLAYGQQLMGGGIHNETGDMTLEGADATNVIEVNQNKLIGHGLVHSEDGGNVSLEGGGISAYGGPAGRDLNISYTRINQNEVDAFVRDDGTTVYAYDDRTESRVHGGGLYTQNMNTDISNVEIAQNKLSTFYSLLSNGGFGTLYSKGGGAYLTDINNGETHTTNKGNTLQGVYVTGNEIEFQLGAFNEAKNVGFNYRAIDIAGGGIFAEVADKFVFKGLSGTDFADISNNKITFVNIGHKKYSPVYLTGGGLSAKGGNGTFEMLNTTVSGNEIKATTTQEASIGTWGSKDYGSIYALGGGIALDGNSDAQSAPTDPQFINVGITGNKITVSAVDDTVYARGGGIYAYMPGYNQDDTPFNRMLYLDNVNINNNIINSESSKDAFASGGGGYFNTYLGEEKHVNIAGRYDNNQNQITTIKNNEANAKATSKDADAEAYGGGLYMYGNGGNSDTSDRNMVVRSLREISGNKATATALFDEAQAQAYGGGIYVGNLKNDNENTRLQIVSVGKETNGTFVGGITGNSAIATALTAPVKREYNYTDPSTGQTYHEEWWDSYSNAYGGGLYANRSKVYINKTNFTNNIAKAIANNEETGYSFGGAIYADHNSIIDIYDSDFKNNTAGSGGAIYADDNSTINLYNTQEKDMVFSGNKVTKGIEDQANGKGSDIYLKSSILNLYTAQDNKDNRIIFNGTIAGDKDSEIHLYTGGGAGKVALSGDGKQYEGKYVLHDGMLMFTGNDNKATDFTMNNLYVEKGKIDLQDTMSGKTYLNDVVTIKRLEGPVSPTEENRGVLDLYVDFDASDYRSMDKLTVDSASYAPNLYLRTINITADGTASTAVYLDGADRNAVTVWDKDHPIQVATTYYTYTFTPDEHTHGLLHLKRNDVPSLTLAEAIADEAYTSYSFTNEGDYITETDLGDLAYTAENTRDFTINGNGHDLNGNEYDGVFTQAGQTLTVRNVPKVKNFGGAAIYNAGAFDDDVEDIHLPAGVVNVVASSFSGNSDDIINSGVLNLQSGDISFEKGILDHTWGSDNGTTNINGANVTLGDNAVIWQNALNINNGSLTARAENIEAAVTNSGTLNLTGSLNYAIAGEGTTNVNNNLIFTYNPETYSQAVISGTLNLNNGILDASGDNSINGFEIGTLDGSGNFSIDARVADEYVDVDCLNILNNSVNAGTVTVNAINLLVEGQTADNVRDFTATVLYGGNSNLAVSQELANAYYKNTTEQKTDDITQNVSWSDVFGTKQRTVTRTLSAVKSLDSTVTDSLQLATVTGEWQEVGTPGDTLYLINTSDAFDEKTFNFASATDVYTSTNDAGTTVGALNINGVASGDNLSTIDLNNHAGFTVANYDAELNISNVDLKGNTNLITNNGTLAFNNTNKLEGNILGVGATDINEGATLTVANIQQGDVSLEGTLKAANATIGTISFGANGVLDAQDGAATTYTAGTVIGGTGAFNIDVDMRGNTPVSDAINITTGGNNIVLTVNDVAVNGTLGNFTVDVLKGQTTGATISLAQAVSDQFNYTGDWENKQSSDALTQTATWDDTFSSRTWQERGVNTISVVDGTKINYTETIEKQNEHETQGETLALLNQATQFTDERKATTSDATKVHNLTADLGLTAAGTYTIQGATQGEDTSTINLNGNTGFVLENGDSVLNLEKVKLVNTELKKSVLDVKNANAKVNFSSVIIDSSNIDDIKNEGALTFNGNNSINVAITGQDPDGDTSGIINVQSGEITFKSIDQNRVTVAQGASVTSKTIDADNGLENNGTVELTGGSSAANVTGNGTLEISGNVDFEGNITQKNFFIGDDETAAAYTGEGNVTADVIGVNGTLVNTGIITANNKFDNSKGTITLNSSASVLNLNGSDMINAGTVDGAGTTVVNGSVQNNGTFASKVVVAAEGALTSLANKITGGVENNAAGGLTLTGGDLASAISGTGTTDIKGDVTNTQGNMIANAVTVTSGSLSTDADKVTGGVTNNAGLTLTGGDIVTDILGTGTTTVSGNVTNTSGKDITNAINVAATGSYEVNANAISSDIANEGTVTLTAGTLGSNITGSGTTAITGAVVNNASIGGSANITGSLDNTNGTLASAAVASGATLTSNADNVTGAVANSGTYDISGGTISGEISGAGAVNINGSVVNNATNTTTGTVTVASDATLTLGSNSNDLFSSAAALTLNDGATLNTQNGTTTATAINNLVIANGANVKVQTKWGDTLNGALAGSTGGVTVTSVDVNGTTGIEGNPPDSYGFTNLGANLALADDFRLANVGETTYNTLTYNSGTGSLSAQRSKLVTAIENTDAGERATYSMATDETGGGGVLEGVLTIQGNGKTVQSDGTSITGSDSIIVGNGTTAGADLIMEDVNLGNITTGAQNASLVVKGGNKIEYKAVTGDVSISGADNGTGVYLESGSLGNSNVAFSAEGGDIDISDNIISDSSGNKVEFKSGNINFSGTFDPAMAVVSGATLTRSGADSGIDWTLTNGTLLYTNDSFLNDSTNSVTFNGGNLDTRNGAVTTFGLSGLTLNPGTTSNFYADVDLAAGTMDNFGSTPVSGTGSLNVAGLNLISDATTDNTTINFTTNTTLMSAVNYTGPQGLTALSPVYKYNVGYDKTTGDFNFARFASGGYGDYNPAILATPVAAQLGGYLTQINSYDQAFRNMDMYMLMTKDQRQAMKMRNKYAADGDRLAYDSSRTADERVSGWVNPYATFENVKLKNGPKVDNTLYGSYFGLESGIQELSNGWDGSWGVYAGYNGSHQHYEGIGIYQNGGALGVNGMLYKDNFFTGLTANVGASAGNASTMYGNDDFAMLMTGVASKTGYNWELADGKFIVQPSYMMSYSMVNTFDYTNAAGVRINSDPLHAIQIEPGLKFIGNLKNGWQPYAGVSVVWNIMDKTKFNANDAALPEMSVKPFVKYGVGVRKTWGERFTGFLQAFITNGGRNGVGLQAGFKWALGKDVNTTSKKTSKMPEKKETKVSLNNIK